MIRHLCEHTLHRTSDFIAVDESSDTLLTSTVNSGEFNIRSTSTGLFECTIKLGSGTSYDSVLYSKRYALFFNTFGNLFSLYDLSLGSLLQTISLPIKSNQKIGVCSACTSREGVFFVSLCSDMVVHMIAYNPDSLKLITVEIPTKDFPVKCRANVQQIACHPSIPIVVIAMTDGTVQLWNFTNAVSCTGGVAEPPPDDQASQRDNDTDDGSNSVSSVGSKPFPSTSSFAFKQISQYFSPVAALVHPDIRDLITSKKKNYQMLSMSVSSFHTFVIWDQKMLCVYSTSVDFISKSKNSHNLSIPIIQPSGKFISVSLKYALCCLHPLCPIVLVISQDEQNIIYILALSLLYPHLPLLDGQSVPHTWTDLTHIKISSLSGCILTVTRSAVRFSRLSQAWCRRFGFNGSIVTRYTHSPLKTFIEGDGLAPVIFALHPLYEATDPSVPFSATYMLSSYNASYNAPLFKHVMTIPKHTVSSISNSSCFPKDIQIEAKELFIPRHLSHTRSIVDSIGLEWELILVGYSLPLPTSNITNDTRIVEGIACRPVVALLKSLTTVSPEIIFLSALDCVYWKSADIILLLIYDGTKLLCLLRQQASTTYDLPTLPLARIWTTPQVIIGLTNTTQTNSKQSLLSCHSYDFKVVSKLSLLSTENVLEVSCQDGESVSHLFSILTDKRLLILTSDLQILKAVASHIVEFNAILSVYWIYDAVVYLESSGRLYYLITPQNGFKKAVQFDQHKLLMLRAAGLDREEGMDENNLLCILPYTQCTSGAVSLIYIGSDRMIYTFPKVLSDSLSVLSLLSRPLISIEPIIKCLLSSERNVATIETVNTLLATYTASPSSSSMSSEHQCAIPSAQSTIKLCLYLYFDLEFRHLAAVTSGATYSVSSIIFSPFPFLRTIPPGFKYIFALSTGHVQEACHDLFTQYPKIQEILAGEAHFSSLTLPHSESRLSKQAIAALFLLLKFGYTNEAVKLSEIAGSDLLFSLLFVLLTQQELLTPTLLASIVEGCPIVKQLLNEENEKLNIPVDKIQLKSLSNGLRKTTLLSAKLPSVTSDPPKEITDIDKVEKMRKAHSTKARGVLGPIVNTTALSLDSVEDYVGRERLDILAGNITGDVKLRFGAQGVNSNVPITAAGASLLRNRPDSWINDVGIGKEWDKVVGYWRFSDFVGQDDPDFVSNGTDTALKNAPHAIMNFIDLSKFGSILELTSDKDTGLETILPVLFETSTSSVDPGEDHEKVKTANDVVFPLQDDPACFSSSVIRLSLRSSILRGTALDVGIYHVDQERRKFTFEVLLHRIPEPSPNKRDKSHVSLHSQRRYVIATRLTGSSGYSLDGRAAIWSLTIDADGMLTFQAGKDDASNMQFIRTSKEDAIKPGSWTHVAVVLDSNPSMISNDGKIDATNANVSIYLDSQLVITGEIIFQETHEKLLAISTMYIGLNLFGFRLTELRLWADTRTSTELENNMDNYLPHASKRKRLQFRIKGSTKIFGGVKVGEGNKQAILTPPSAFPQKGSLTLAKPLMAPSSLLSSVVSKRRGTFLAPIDERLDEPPAERPADLKRTSDRESSTVAPIYLSSLPDLSMSIKDILGCLRQRPIPTQAFNNSIAFVNKLDKMLTLLQFTAANVTKTLINLPAESVISSLSSAVVVLLTLDNKTLVVYDIIIRKILFTQAMAVPLVFWSFVEVQLVLIATPHAVYSWATNVSGAPVKQFDRQDIASKQRWAERKVIDLLSTDTLIMLTTCKRVNEMGGLIDQPECDDDMIVTVFIKATGICCSFYGVAVSSILDTSVSIVYKNKLTSTYDIGMIHLTSITSNSAGILDMTTVTLFANVTISLCLQAVPSSSHLVPVAYVFISNEKNVLHIVLRNGEYVAFALDTFIKKRTVSLLDDPSLSILACGLFQEQITDCSFVILTSNSRLLKADIFDGIL